MMMLSVDDNNFVGDDGDKVYSLRVVSSLVMKTEIGRLVSQMTQEIPRGALPSQ